MIYTGDYMHILQRSTIVTFFTLLLLSVAISGSANSCEITGMCLGYRYSAVSTDDGELWLWGDGNPVPYWVQGIDNIKTFRGIEGKINGLAIVKSDNTLWIWDGSSSSCIKGLTDVKVANSNYLLKMMGLYGTE